MRFIVFITILFISACYQDETVAGYSDAEKTWVLSALDNAPFTILATVEFPEDGKISGQAPCNRYTGAMTAPYPKFEAKQVASTKMACPHLDEETRFFEALSAMTLAEVSGDVMTLTSESGRKMIFKAGE